jgi:transposase
MWPGKGVRGLLGQADRYRRDPEAEIFVGVLGASNLTYAEATWTQKTPDWTGNE